MLRKMCVIFQWFESVVESYQNDFIDTAADVDLEQLPQIFKFSGDFHYHKQNYEIAAERYRRALGKVVLRFPC